MFEQMDSRTSHSNSMDRGSNGNNIQEENFIIDVEDKATVNSYLLNNSVQHLTWNRVTVTVKDHKTKEPKAILDNIDGIAKAGMQQNSFPFIPIVI